MRKHTWVFGKDLTEGFAKITTETQYDGTVLTHIEQLDPLTVRNVLPSKVIGSARSWPEGLKDHTDAIKAWKDAFDKLRNPPVASSPMPQPIVPVQQPVPPLTNPEQNAQRSDLLGNLSPVKNVTPIVKSSVTGFQVSHVSVIDAPDILSRLV